MEGAFNEVEGAESKDIVDRFVFVDKYRINLYGRRLGFAGEAKRDRNKEYDKYFLHGIRFGLRLVKDEGGVRSAGAVATGETYEGKAAIIGRHNPSHPISI